MSSTWQILLFLIGAGMGWLLRSLRQRPADTRIEEELRQQRGTQDAELNRLRTELNSIGAAKAAAENGLATIRSAQLESKAAADEARRELDREMTSLREELTETKIAKGSIAAELAAERKALTERRSAHEERCQEVTRLGGELLAVQRRNGDLEAQIKLLNERLTTERQQIEKIQDTFRKEFEAISNKLLVDSSSRFSQQSSESLEKLLLPLKETLGHFKTSLDTTRNETATHSALLKEQIGRVGTEAANLSKALKGDVKVLGNWGENMLDQILDKSGLQLNVHYRRQSSAKNSEGDQRFLDVIVELPEGRNLVIDSKVSLRSYEEAVNCPDESTRQEHLHRHVEALRTHLRGLGGKRYHAVHGINTPDFVMMYLPIEAAFFAAITEEPALFGEALEQDVVLITNSTLLATLRTVAHVWRLADQQKHALEIADRGGRLYDKFVGFVQDLQEVGKALRNGQDAWEGAWNKLHSGAGNLVRQAEQLKALGAKASKALPAALVDQAGAENQGTAPPVGLASGSDNIEG